LVIPSVFTVAGCAQMLPARSTLISPGVYQLKAYGNSFARRETLQAKFDKKAEKLCEAQPFTWQDDGNFEVKQERTYNNGGTQTNYYVVLTRTVKCVAAQ